MTAVVSLSSCDVKCWKLKWINKLYWIRNSLISVFWWDKHIIKEMHQTFPAELLPPHISTIWPLVYWEPESTSQGLNHAGPPDEGQGCCWETLRLNIWSLRRRGGSCCLGWSPKARSTTKMLQFHHLQIKCYTLKVKTSLWSLEETLRWWEGQVLVTAATCQEWNKRCVYLL